MAVTKKLQGLISAPFTPMNSDGSLNLSIIPQYYELLKLNNVKGAFICGSTGEGVSLTKDEKKKVLEAWAFATKEDPDFKIITLVGGNCLTEAIELAKHAEDCGAYAVALTAPSYFRPATIRTLARCCEMVASAVPDILFYYYHIPVLTGVNFPMLELLKELDGKLSNLAGIKYTHEDFMDFLSCLNFNSGKYDMLWGRDENMLSALILGAKGAVGSTYNYAAPLYTQLISAYEKGDVVSARQLQQKAVDMIRLLPKYGGISTGKAFMKLIGMDCGEFRLPVSNMDSQQFIEFSNEALNMGFMEFCSGTPALLMPNPI